MARKMHVGVGGLARNVKAAYLGVNGVARKVKKAYVGVNGVARLFWDGGGPLTATLSVGPDYGIPVGTQFYFRCEAKGGSPPYTYRYYMSRNNAEFTYVDGLSGEAPVTYFSQTGNFKFRVVVSDNAGAEAAAETELVLIRATNDTALNLTLIASRDGGTGIATWSLSSTSQGARWYSLVVLRNGLYYRGARNTYSISLLLTEPGTYTAVGAMHMIDSNTACTVSGGPIVVT